MKAIGSVYAELIMKPLMVVWCQSYMMFVEGPNHAHKIHNKSQVLFSPHVWYGLCIEQAGENVL